MADYLVTRHGFERIHLAPPAAPLEREQRSAFGAAYSGTLTFENGPSLLEHVTKRWRQRWVTTDVWNERILEEFLRRPSFLLVSVDAPVSIRWKRLKERWDLREVI